MDGQLAKKKKNLNAIHHINRLKKKNPRVISVDAEKACDKTQYSVMIKTFNKLEIERNFLNLIKVIYETPTFRVIFNSEKLNAF